MPVIKNLAPYSDENGNVIIGAPRNPGLAIVTFGAKNCKVIFGENVTFRGGINFHKDGSSVTIGAGSTLQASMGLGEGCHVVLGEKTACAGPIEIVAYDGSGVTVGDDCLFASGVQLRGWDQHPIYDLRTGKRTNYGRSVVIGSRVWMAKDAVALPGSEVGDGCIIGLRAVVTSSAPIPPHCVAVGQPARVVRKYAAWAKGPAVPHLPGWENYPPVESLPYFDETPASKTTQLARALHKVSSTFLTYAESRKR